jgi:hypothetical protein
VVGLAGLVAGGVPVSWGLCRGELLQHVHQGLVVSLHLLLLKHVEHEDHGVGCGACRRSGGGGCGDLGRSLSRLRAVRPGGLDVLLGPEACHQRHFGVVGLER